MAQKQTHVQPRERRNGGGENEPDELPAEMNEISQRVSNDAQDVISKIKEVTSSR